MDINTLEEKLGIANLSDAEKLALVKGIESNVQASKAAVKAQEAGQYASLVVDAIKRIKSDLETRFNELNGIIDVKAKSLKDGKDGLQGAKGEKGDRGFDGVNGKDGYNGKDGIDGVDGKDGVGVQDAYIDFDGSLVIKLTDGRELNVGDVVPPETAANIKLIGAGGGTSQAVLDSIASLQTQVDTLIPSQTGNSGKYLTTNGTSTSWASIAAGGLSYQGTWNATSNTPTLASSTGTNGYYYIVATAGSTNLNGITDWQIGDWLLFNGSTWQKIDQTNSVTSVAGRTGAITLSTSDISGLGTIATQAANNVSITGGSITGITDLAVADGGTGASTASGARTNLGLVIGTDVLAPNGSAASLTSFPTLNQNTTGTASNVTGTVAVANGGTGATTASGARTNLGLVIGTDVLSPTGSAASLTSFPTFNQNTTGTASNVTGTVAIANGGTGATTAGAALTALGAYAASNPSGYTSNTGTVTSITAGTGLSGGTITSSGTVALANTAVTAGSYTLANITVDAQGRITSATNGSAGSGTVTSVGMTTPTGLSVSGSPVTTSGTLALSMTAGYAIPTTASQTNWNTAYGWGNHASAGYVVSGGALGTPSSGTLTNCTFPTLNQNTTGTAANVTGTVAVANGGTGATTASGARTNLGLVIGTDVLAPNGSAASLTSFPTFNQNTTGTASNVTGTVAIANGGTGQTTTSAGFNALSPITTTGDLIIGNGTNSATRLAIGTNAYVLTSNGATASWQPASGGGGGSSPIPKLQSWSIGGF